MRLGRARENMQFENVKKKIKNAKRNFVQITHFMRKNEYFLHKGSNVVQKSRFQQCYHKCDPLQRIQRKVPDYPCYMLAVWYEYHSSNSLQSSDYEMLVRHTPLSNNRCYSPTPVNY